MRNKNKESLKNAPQQVRIIGGVWRGSKLPVMMRDGLRPTASRTRETLFNWLQPIIQGSDCLDLFAGSGVLGFEAVSRGAAQADLIEMDRQVVAHLQQQVLRLQARQVSVIHQAAQEFISQTHQQYDVVFIDPPFHQIDLVNLLTQLHTRQIVKADAKIYVEAPKQCLPDKLPANWVWQRQSQAGEVEYGLIST